MVGRYDSHSTPQFIEKRNDVRNEHPNVNSCRPTASSQVPGHLETRSWFPNAETQELAQHLAVAPQVLGKVIFTQQIIIIVLTNYQILHPPVAPHESSPFLLHLTNGFFELAALFVINCTHPSALIPARPFGFILRRARYYPVCVHVYRRGFVQTTEHVSHGEITSIPWAFHGMQEQCVITTGTHHIVTAFWFVLLLVQLLHGECLCLFSR